MQLAPSFGRINYEFSTHGSNNARETLNDNVYDRPGMSVLPRGQFGADYQYYGTATQPQPVRCGAGQWGCSVGQKRAFVAPQIAKMFMGANSRGYHRRAGRQLLAHIINDQEELKWG